MRTLTCDVCGCIVSDEFRRNPIYISEEQVEEEFECRSPFHNSTYHSKGIDLCNHCRVNLLGSDDATLVCEANMVLFQDLIVKLLQDFQDDLQHKRKPHASRNRVPRLPRKT